MTKAKYRLHETWLPGRFYVERKGWFGWRLLSDYRTNWCGTSIFSEAEAREFIHYLDTYVPRIIYVEPA